MFTALIAKQTRYGRSVTPSTLHHIRATLRSALNAAIRDGLLRDNPDPATGREHRSSTGATAWLRVRGYISTARKHGINVMTAIRDAVTGNPWTGHPPPPFRPEDRNGYVRCEVVLILRGRCRHGRGGRGWPRP
jgi:hypothetical protein